MRLQRIFLCLLILSATTTTLFGQDSKIRFDSTGRLTQLDYTPSYKKGPFFVYKYYKSAETVNRFCNQEDAETTRKNILAAMAGYDVSQKELYRKGLSNNIKKTIEAMEDDDKNLRPFLDSLLDAGQRVQYKTDIETLKTIFDADDATADSSALSTYFSSLVIPFNNNLKKTNNDNSFFVSGFNDSKIELWRKNQFNLFVIQYYNATYAAAPDALKRLNRNEILTNKNRFDFFTNKADSLLKLVYKNNGTVEWEHFVGMRDFIAELAKADPGFRLERRPYTFEEMKTLFKNDWFKQWLWFRSGTISINPLGFTTEQNFQISAGDEELTKMSNRYVDTMLARHLRFDTAANVDRYDKLLLQKGKAKERINTSDKVKELIKANTTEMDKLIITSNLLNKVQIPKTGMFASFSATDGFNDTQPDLYVKKYLSFSLREEDKKIIALYNIPKGYKGKLIEENKAIPFRSNFQDGLDTALSYAGKVFAFATQLSPYASIFGVNSKENISNRIVTLPAVLDAGRGTPASESFYDRLKISLEKSGKFDSIAFKRTRDSINLDSGLNRQFNLKRLPNAYRRINSNDLNNYYNTFFDKYEQVLEIRKKEVFNEVRKDSLLLSGMYTIFDEAKLLPKKLEEKSDKDPAFFTSILSTSPSDSSIEKKVTPIAYARDTLSAQSFKYKAGKRMSWQLGAGLSYTVANFTQTKATEENGQIKIENTSQAYRFIVGMHYHFGKGLFVHDNRFGGRFVERSSAYLGVGIPKPLENVYLGYAYDLVPGLKLTTGLHFYRNDTYTILNNSIIDKKLRYNVAFPFFAIQIDPNSLLKTLQIIKN